MSEDDPSFEPERFAMFDNERWTGSDTYHTTTGEERRLLAPFFLWQSENGPIPDDAFVLYRIAWCDEREAGPDFLARLRGVLSKAFELSNRTWLNKTAMQAYRKHNGRKKARSESARKAGLASAEARRKGTAVERGVERDVQRLSPSPSISGNQTLTERGCGGKPKPKQTALALVAPPAPLRAAAERYLHARALRLHPDKADAEEYGKLSPGTCDEVAKYMGKLHARGFPLELLSSLPALTDNEGLCKRATVLLRDGEHGRVGQDGKTYGATCHAEVIDSTMSDLTLEKRQVEILRIIGTADYVASRGARARGGWE